MFVWLTMYGGFVAGFAVGLMVSSVLVYAATLFALIRKLTVRQLRPAAVSRWYAFECLTLDCLARNMVFDVRIDSSAREITLACPRCHAVCTSKSCWSADKDGRR